VWCACCLLGASPAGGRATHERHPLSPSFGPSRLSEGSQALRRARRQGPADHLGGGVRPGGEQARATVGIGSALDRGDTAATLLGVRSQRDGVAMWLQASREADNAPEVVCTFRWGW